MPAVTPAPVSLKEFDVPSLFVVDKATRDASAATLAALAQKQGPAALSGVSDAILKALADKKSAAAREGAADTILALAKQGAVKSLEPSFIGSGLYAALLEAFADKMPAVRTAAVEAVREYVAAMNPWATALILPALLHEIKTAGKWQIKTGALVVLNQLVVSAPTQMARLMPEIVPILADAIWDTKADVKKAARDSLTKATALVSNKDIERFIPALIKALINPVEEVPGTIALLSATTFVSEVDSPTLSLMVPLLSRGLSEKLTATKRKVAVIVDNMAKLVDSPITVRPFLPKLLPGLLKVETSIGDPEARGVIGKAIATLRQVGDVPTGDGSDLPPFKVAEAGALGQSLVAIYKKLGGEISVADPMTIYTASLAANLVNMKNFDVPQWDGLAPYLALSQTVSALPTKRAITDPEVLNFALTLEHLEATFYKDSLAKFSEADFSAAGYPDWTRGRFVQIQQHEATHVEFLTTALETAGAPAVQACEYNFPLTDVHSFVNLARVLEEVGTNAYTGGAQLIDNKDYLTAAASILAVEARHEAWISSAVFKASAWDTAFETPLLPNAVYSLAAPFIKSCPVANADSLPALTAYPALAFADANPRAGHTVGLTFDAPKDSAALFAAFVSGPGAPVFVPIQNGNQVAIPQDLRGFVFCFVTNDGAKLDDSTTVAGPAILNVEFDSRGNVV